MQQFREVILHCCFTSTEARWLIRDGDRVGRGRKSEGSTADTARRRPERPWTAARTMEVLAVSPRHCPSTCALRSCCFNCLCLDRVTKTMSDNVLCMVLLLTNNLDNSKQKKSNFRSPAPPPYSWSLLG